MDVDPALVLAELICRLRHEGVPVSADLAGMVEAHRQMAGVLGALGVSAGAGPLDEADYLLLRCAAAQTSVG